MGVRICVIGAGYVGLAAGACLADVGNQVNCVDHDPGKLQHLMNGQSPLMEAGLAEMIGRNVQTGRLTFSVDIDDALRDAQVVILSVGTGDGMDGHSDLSQIQQLVRRITIPARDYKVIAIKSTVPVGTAQELAEMIRQEDCNPHGCDIVSNPEFLRQGSAVQDFMNPSRIVLGADSERPRELMRDVYSDFIRRGVPVVFTSTRTAELSKYAANAFLAMKITYANEMADICTRMGAVASDVSFALSLDPRIGAGGLTPGPGLGGSCLPKDLRSIVRQAAGHGARFTLGEAAIRANDARRQRVIDSTREITGTFSGVKVCLLGLTFKANTDDIRDSISMGLAKAVLTEGGRVAAYDPGGMKSAQAILPGLSLHEDPYSACQGADVIVIATEWDEFKMLDLRKMRVHVRTANLYDLRGVVASADAQAAGFVYRSL